MEVVPNDKQQFAIVMRDGERIALHTQERNRLLTEIAIERERLVVRSWEGVSQESYAEIQRARKFQEVYQNVKHQRDIFAEDPEACSKRIELFITSFGICANYESVRQEMEEDYQVKPISNYPSKKLAPKPSV